MNRDSFSDTRKFLFNSGRFPLSAPPGPGVNPTTGDSPPHGFETRATQARSGATALSSNCTCCLPSRGCVAVSVTVPGCSWARIQMAPVPPTQREGIIADDLRRAVEFQLDGVIGKGPNGAEFVGYAQNHARRVRPVGIQLQCRPGAGRISGRLPFPTWFSRSPACLE